VPAGLIPGDGELLFLPLGGCGEIGMNLNLFGHAGQWIMVDCGITFERDGLDSRIELPDPRFIVARRDRLAGIIITHAHEDHLGALSLLWPQLQAPVYATPFAAEVLRRKAAGRGGALPQEIHRCDPGSALQLGPFTIDWLPITHSTPETCALHIRTAAGSVLHTADWKIDVAPVVGPAFDGDRFARVGRSSPDAVICDSTNAPRQGFSVSESAVAEGLEKVIGARSGRVVVACFASNVARLVTLARVARRCRRYAALFGRSLETMRAAAAAADLLPRDFSLVEPAHLGYLPREEVLAIATGSQGEPGAALSRLAADTHPALSLEAGDTVILSSRTIPGNEVPVERLLDRLRARDIEIVSTDDCAHAVHASGHPCAGELAQMYRWLQPRLAVPVHGEERHMAANAAIARDAGVPLALTGRNGDLFYLAPQPAVRRRAAPVGRLTVDAEGQLQSAPGQGDSG
jgi:ribonuclease J